MAPDQKPSRKPQWRARFKDRPWLSIDQDGTRHHDGQVFYDKVILPALLAVGQKPEAGGRA